MEPALATSNDGTLGRPMIGDFKNGHGEFYDQEPLNGRAIFVRWVQSFIAPNTCHLEQSFSNDGGKTWEVNWVNAYTRGGMIRTTRTELRRMSSRGSHDCETIYRILDAGFLASVGFCKDGQPFVIPTLYGRKADKLYLHGSAASRLLCELEAGLAVCVCVTLIDGLVLSRSAFHHSMNYRSAVAFGTARSIEKPAQKIEALRIISEHLVPGRWKDVRGPSEQELRATKALEFSIDEASAKLRTGPPLDDASDYEFPVWAGVLPLAMRCEAPVPDERSGGGIEVPDYVRLYDTRLNGATKQPRG